MIAMPEDYQTHVKGLSMELQTLGLRTAVKSRLDEINETTSYMSYASHMYIVEMIDEVLTLIDLHEGGQDGSY